VRHLGDQLPAGAPATAPPRLRARGVGKTYGAVAALDQVDVDVQPGEILALCGENGAGKSTFVRIVTGTQRADRGTLAFDGQPVELSGPQHAQRLGTAIVDQELSLAPALSVIDNIWLGHREVPVLHRRRRLRARGAELLASLGLTDVDLDAPVCELPIGERQLVEIARLLARDARLLILDEPTATLSDAEIERTFAALRGLAAQGRSVILVTHRLGEVFELCDRVVVFRNGRVAGTRRVADIDRAHLIELMLGRELTEVFPPAAAAPGAPVLTVRSLCIPGQVRSLDLTVRRGEVVGLAGQLGSSAGHTLRALAGLVPGADAEVTVGDRPLRLGSVGRALDAGLLYLSDDRAHEGVFLDQPVEHNLTVARLGALSRGGMLSRRGERQRAVQIAGRVGFDPGRIGARVDQLSGGNQQKVALGRYCDATAPAGVLLLHEPTRGVDVGARAEIYATVRELCAAGYAVLMTSSDLEELLGMSDRIYTMFRGARVGEYERSAFDMGRILHDITAAA
jgi:ABC-type sugar transport system ATPase subunit